MRLWQNALPMFDSEWAKKYGYENCREYAYRIYPSDVVVARIELVLNFIQSASDSV
jgi:hypothetical protein